jgi:hypothetical protein
MRLRIHPFVANICALIAVSGIGADLLRCHAAETIPPVQSQPVQSQPFTQPASGPFATSVTNATLDIAASREWVDGAERPYANPEVLRQAMWTQSSPSGSALLLYGASAQPGVRHLRIGFTGPVAVGSILVRGGDQLSVLRAGAAYPGNLADDTQWIPAQRLVQGQPSAAPVDKQGYAVWILPQGTATRALRFTHTAAASDGSFAGTLGGVYVLSARLANLAPQAIVIPSANTAAGNLLTDESYNDWRTWDNGPTYPHAVTSSTPEFITLAWPRPVTLKGLAALWAGFNAANVQILSGADSISAQDAPESAWQTIGQPWTLHNQYPRALGVDWFDFGKSITTRAVRVRITAVTDESHHPHLVGHTRNGTRVWLGELMALSPLGTVDLKAAALPVAADSGPKPPIPVRFTLDAPGFVTLVIDDAKGNRVRNLVSDTWFEAGQNTVWWDGTDDLGRNSDAAIHGVYLIPTHFVAPGTYQVHGLTHKAIDLHYEFSVYNAGNPPWDTVDGKGGWLTNHTPPSSALFVPAGKAPGGKPLVYLGSYVSEGGSGLAWVDLDGVKQGGRGWIGGNWTAAPFLAYDAGSHAVPGTYAYVGAAWSGDASKTPARPAGVIRITALTAAGDKAVLKYDFDPDTDHGNKLDRDASGAPVWTNQMAGLAARDGLLVISLSRMGQLLFASAATGKVIGLAPLDDPRGVAFDNQGRLLALSGKTVVRFDIPAVVAQGNLQQLPKPNLIAGQLEDPAGITVAANGDIYISDRGDSHQVKVFTADGKLLRTIGHPGAPKAGPYDSQHMNNPRGLAIDSNQHLWVAEEDFQPKRVSEWTLDGKLIKAFYGPAEYGGGGSIDPQDKTKFYYHAMEFNLDWKAGTNVLSSVLYRSGDYRSGDDPLQLSKYGTPGNVFYSNGHRYFTNTYLGNTTSGVTIALLYLDQGSDHNGTIRPVAAFGNANDWSLLKTDAFKSVLPPGTDLNSRSPDKAVIFAWSDLNDDGKAEPNEVTCMPGAVGEIGMMLDSAKPGPDSYPLAMYASNAGGKAVRFAPARISAAGVPVYDLHAGQVVVDGTQKAISDGGGQILWTAKGTVLSTAPAPFAVESVGGVDNAGHRWSYPSLWPGLHPSHSAPVPDKPGELIGTTRLLGGFVTPVGADTAPLWGINGNMGDMYLFTQDGLFVKQLFRDVRKGNPWSMPVAARNMLLNDVSLHDENFFPSLTQTSDGMIYVLDGSRTSIVRVDGLDTLRRIGSTPLQVTQQDIAKAQTFMQQSEASRQQMMGAQSIEVGLRSAAPASLKAMEASMKTAAQATVDSRITKDGWADKPDVVQAAVSIARDRLYAVFQSSDPNLLRNSGAIANAPFKTGGALDLMIGTDAHADPKRVKPVEGDVRLLVYLVNGRPHATLYRAVVPGTTAPVPFSSPSRTITLDRVDDVSDKLEFDAASGSYAFSIPLEVLGLKPAAGQHIKADIGILRGNGVQTTQRVYWSNKATGITADVPSEAELTPNLWGDWVFKAEQ